jgi:hypothetical protein
MSLLEFAPACQRQGWSMLVPILHRNLHDAGMMLTEPEAAITCAGLSTVSAAGV